MKPGTDSISEAKKIEDDLKEYKDNIGKFVLYGDKKYLSIRSYSIRKARPKLLF
ncbi:hypothetical protein KUH03_13645 [Sphingobacterium sp. E70]|uniref:hypothetical protein n=1 Tax=Sphingobacterium sp. E70 TaxID=2853439 RepID=UPI00211C5A3A|nr:hypothetical protein [Sphingobacterium sp. E70]ULT27652.1 hypothetical protein KUH03_13645 [Sphingobacterium sp. E70]